MYRDGSENSARNWGGRSAQEVVKALREASLLESMVPLSKERRPFRDLSDETILGYLRFHEKYPEALGRFSYVVKKVLGLIAPCPAQFTIKESHFDLNTLEPELLAQLVPLGFEPDHFASLNPREYKWCLTMKMEIPAGPNHRQRVRQIHDMMFRNSLKAERISQRYEDVFGYLEMETYSSKTRHVIPFKEVSDEGLAAFPFEEGEFLPLTLPSTESEASKLNLSLTSHKLLDIHVKVPSEARGAGFEGADSRRMEKLRRLFLAAGFYEIYSEAGNWLYTIQLLDQKPGKEIFFRLRDWASVHGGVTGIKLETCNYFVRTPRHSRGFVRLAPIPDLVEVRGFLGQT